MDGKVRHENKKDGLIAVRIMSPLSPVNACKCGPDSHIKVTTKGSWCFKCKACWPAGEEIRVVNVSWLLPGVIWTEDATDLAEYAQVLEEVKGACLPKVFGSSLYGQFGEKKASPKIEVSGSALDPYCGSSLRDQLGQKDREIQLLRHEVGRLSMELLRTKKNKEP